MAAQSQQTKVAAASVSDATYTGSADAWLLGTPYASASRQLYTVAVARSCASPGAVALAALGTPCMELPTAGLLHIATNNTIIIFERPYGTLDTTVGANYSVLLSPVLVFVNTTGRPC